MLRLPDSKMMKAVQTSLKEAKEEDGYFCYEYILPFEQDETIDSVLFRCRYYYSEDRIEEYPMPAFE